MISDSEVSLLDNFKKNDIPFKVENILIYKGDVLVNSRESGIAYAVTDKKNYII